MLDADMMHEVSTMVSAMVPVGVGHIVFLAVGKDAAYVSSLRRADARRILAEWLIETPAARGDVVGVARAIAHQVAKTEGQAALERMAISLAEDMADASKNVEAAVFLTGPYPAPDLAYKLTSWGFRRTIESWLRNQSLTRGPL